MSNLQEDTIPDPQHTEASTADKPTRQQPEPRTTPPVDPRQQALLEQALQQLRQAMGFT